MDKEKESRRKQYTKPEVRRVQLTPEESLATGCKVTTETASVANTCISGSCFDTGS